MAQSKKKRIDTRLHCQHCGSKRQMMQFMAIDTEAETKDGKPLVLPFNVRKFLELIQSDVLYKLPKFYAGTCNTCFQTTYFQGQNHDTKLEVIPS